MQEQQSAASRPAPPPAEVPAAPQAPAPGAGKSEERAHLGKSLARAIGQPVLEVPGRVKAVERLHGASLRLTLGDRLTLRPSAVDRPYGGRVVGLDPYEFILVQTRMPRELLTALAQNRSMVVQLSTTGVLFGFRTQVQNAVANPSQMLFLAYPASVERVVLRRDERVSVSLPGTLHGRYGDHEVILVDLTPGGCRFSAKTDLKSPLRQARSGDQVVLRCELGRGQELTASVELRSIEEAHGRISMGGLFLNMGEDTARLVAEYVRRMLPFMRE